MVSPPTNSSEASSHSTLPSLRAMNPSRLATMWIVTQESTFAIVSPYSASGRQSYRCDAMLQGPEPLSDQQAGQAALGKHGEEPHRQPGHEAVRAQEGLGLLALVLLDGDDLRHPLRRNLPRGRVDG